MFPPVPGPSPGSRPAALRGGASRTLDRTGRTGIGMRKLGGIVPDEASASAAAGRTGRRGTAVEVWSARHGWPPGGGCRWPATCWWACVRRRATGAPPGAGQSRFTVRRAHPSAYARAGSNLAAITPKLRLLACDDAGENASETLASATVRFALTGIAAGWSHGWSVQEDGERMPDPTGRHARPKAEPVATAATDSLGRCDHVDAVAVDLAQAPPRSSSPGPCRRPHRSGCTACRPYGTRHVP